MLCVCARPEEEEEKECRRLFVFKFNEPFKCVLAEKSVHKWSDHSNQSVFADISAKSIKRRQTKIEYSSSAERRALECPEINLDEPRPIFKEAFLFFFSKFKFGGLQIGNMNSSFLFQKKPVTLQQKSLD